MELPRLFSRPSLLAQGEGHDPMDMGRGGESAHFGSESDGGRFVVLLVGPSDTVNWTGLRVTLVNNRATRVFGPIETAREALDAVKRTPVDVVIVGAETGGVAIGEIARWLQDVAPATQIVAVTQTIDQNVVRAWDDGLLAGYLLWEDMTARSLATVLAAIVRNDLHVESREVTRQRRERAERSLAQSTGTILSPGEIEVLRGVQAHLSIAHIGKTIGMSRSSVRRIIARLEKRFGARSLYELGREIERSHLDC